MRQKLLFCFLLCFALSWSLVAQERSITGKVTDAETGEGIPGVSVFIKGTNSGTVTDGMGNYSISASVGTTLVFQAVGIVAKEVIVGAESIINVTLVADTQQLGEVIITGTATGVVKEKLAFSVATVDSRLIQQVPGVDPGQALQGKIAGVTVVQGATPSDAPSIRFRGATQLTAGNAPLVLVDGIITDGSLADINAEDIMRIEAVKGASGASLYGSRAGNGVLQVITRRGLDLPIGTTRVRFRTEYGSSSTIKDYPLATKHPYVVNPDGTFARTQTGAVLQEADGLVNNDFPRFTNQQKRFFSPGSFMTNYLSIEGNSGKTNFLVSFQNMDRTGVIKVNNGFQRQNFRVNVDHSLSKKLTLSTSTLFSRSVDDAVTNGQGGPFFALIFMPPNADLEASNSEDGSPYNWNAAREALPGALEINPLYRMSNNKITDRRNRLLSNVELKYDILEWLTLSGQFSLDKEDSRGRNIFPVGYLPNQPTGSINGILTENSFNRTSINAWLNLLIKKKFGDFNTVFRASYLWEDSRSDFISAQARNFPVPNIINLGAGDPAQYSATSNFEVRKAENYFATASLDYKDKYILDALFRVDGSSLFGENNRYRNFYRLSGAWRITKDFNISGIDEWKLRASYGTSGQRPGVFDAQYETYTVSGGTISPQTLGNRDLKPSISSELEIGTDIAFLKRFTFTFNYAKTVTKDQILLAPLSANAGGFLNQWRNAGTLEGTVFEAALNANVIKTKNITWDLGLVFNRIRQKVTKLGIPPQRFGPGNNGEADSPPFFLREGENLGIMYGERYAQTPEDMALVLGTNNQPVDAALYSRNSDGLMVLTSSIGTSAEVPVRMTNPADGTRNWKIGDSNPDFNLALNSTFSWKNLSVYFLFDWKQGGDVYNLSRQWAIRELRHQFVDGGKHASYYGNVSNFSTVPTNYFVEDGSFVKLRELNISYGFTKSQLMKLGDWAKLFQEIRLSLVGRNLFMITKYSGVDPEASAQPPLAPGASNNFDRTLFGYDAFGYPQFRTISGSIQITF
ncbi:MAG: SusC/RagA family TonB-linked outer membrane protein [Microscillaceae bacterium]|jgi:TonB-linked SusC/RagA family outer membrane protein|nr:SusC/RagA family TonB-linked outer membrane protein [Microscillaceae bacterium]